MGSKKQINLLMQHNIKSTPAKHTFDIKLGFKALSDILNLIGSHGIKAFPTAGTLLGLHREKELLAFDKDIDIAIYSNDDFEMLKILIDKNPRYAKSHDTPPFTSYFCVQDLETNVTIDLLSFKQEDTVYEYGWFLPGIHKKRESNTPIYSF
jgi:phosphorylcholine metabolism protein LicD